MRMLRVPGDLWVPDRAMPFLARLPLELSDDDGMYHGNDRHYLKCGASALHVILEILSIAGAPFPGAVLDFGAGAGRVTRWLRAGFPQADLHACELREQDVVFNATVLGVRSWQTGTELSKLQAPGRYDVIWAGSVATHLPAGQAELLLDTLVSWTNPDGIVVLSLHGRYARARQLRAGYRYIHDDAWTTIEAGYEATGYGYADYPSQSGYGIAVTRLSWISALVERRPGIRLVCLAETAWDDHHDIVAVQNRAI